MPPALPCLGVLHLFLGRALALLCTPQLPSTTGRHPIAATPLRVGVHALWVGVHQLITRTAGHAPAWWLCGCRNSDGFCCKCTLGQILGLSSKTSGSSDTIRGGLSCSLKSKTSASCLRFDDTWWWSGYTIDSYQLYFQVALNITTVTSASNSSAGNSSAPAAANAATTSSEVLTITPSQPFVINNAKTLSAKLLGDLESYAQIPDLSGQYLLVPSPPGQGPNEILSSNLDEWMVVDSSMVTTTGLECNKIGISYT